MKELLRKAIDHLTLSFPIVEPDVRSQKESRVYVRCVPCSAVDADPVTFRRSYLQGVSCICSACAGMAAGRMATSWGQMYLLVATALSLALIAITVGLTSGGTLGGSGMERAGARNSKGGGFLRVLRWVINYARVSIRTAGCGVSSLGLVPFSLHAIQLTFVAPHSISHPSNFV